MEQARNHTVTCVSYRPKRILNVHRHVDGGWLWTKYSAHPYVGCQEGCVYCYWRDEKYNMLARDPDSSHLADSFSQYIKVKTNAAQLLRKELLKVPRDVIAVGDYQPIEARYSLSREMLKVCLELGFPTLVLEKSPLVLRDLDIVSQINERTWACVMFSIVRADSTGYGEIFEPYAPRIEGRFSAMRNIADSGILTGTAFMPILPYICDDDSNIEAVVRKTAENGGRFVLAGGLTMSGSQATFYLKVLKRHNPALVEKYMELYKGRYSPLDRDYVGKIGLKVKALCEKYGIFDKLPITWRHLFSSWGPDLDQWTGSPKHIRTDIEWRKTGHLRCRQCRRSPDWMVPIDDVGKVLWICTKDRTHIVAS